MWRRRCGACWRALVASGYDFRTAVDDKAGAELAKSPDASGVIHAEIDLNDRMLWPWLGDWRSRIWREGPGPIKDPGGR